MNARRGDGVGIEVTTTVVRGVRLGHQEPGRVAAAAEVPIVSFDDQSSIFDALIRLAGQLGEVTMPTRVAWFPARSTMQRLDVTGLTPQELNQIRHDLADRVNVSSTMLVDADARRWMLALRWDHSVAWRIEELVERAGFIDVAVEPAPVALERVVADGTTVARRDASVDRSWAALYDGAVTIAATTIETAGREYPNLTVASTHIGLSDLDEVLTEGVLGDEVARLVTGAVGSIGRSSELDARLQLLGEPYPPFPAHDLRAPQRLAVALGAALGAAGLAGRLRPVDVTPTRYAAVAAVKPWAVERITDVSDELERPTVPWWHRPWRALVRR